MTDEKPVFIPLKREYYEAFERAEKDEEYRPLGPRWNPTVCRIGRRVTLSCGYGKKERMHGTIISFRVEYLPHQRLKGWAECYPMSNAPAACIGIGL